MRVAAALLLSLTLLAGPTQAGSELLRLRRMDGEPFVALLQRPAVARAPVVLVLHDRACGPTRTPPARIDAPPGMARLALAAEPAAGPSGAGCLQAPTEARVLDVMTAVAALRADAPWWDRRLYLVGLSEGALAALAAAALLPEARGVVLVNPPPDAPGRAEDLRKPVLVLQPPRAERAVVATGGPVLRRPANAPAAVEVEVARFLVEQERRLEREQPAAPSAPVRTAGPAANSGKAAGRGPALTSSTKDGPAPSRAVATPRKRPTTDAPPPRAMAARVRPSPSTPSRPVARPAPRLRAKLPAGPSLPPETRPSAPRT